MFLTSVGLPSYNWQDKLPEIWQYTRWFLEENQIFVMIAVGFFAAVGVVSLVLTIFERKEKEEEDLDWEDF